QLTPSGLKIIDMSGQGLTSIPINLITTKDVGHLLLPSNNLHSITPDIVRMKSLEKLDISKNELALLTNLTELNISECNLSFMPPAILKMTSLKVLDISRNKINILVPEIGQLVNLVRLNLQQTNITSLPPEIAYCQEMEQLHLWGNAIETLPETLSEMSQLKALAINYRSFCGVVDPYMESLLKKGQIKSEHIPSVVFELPALQVLDLENTKLNTLPDINNTVLKELYLSKNFMQVYGRCMLLSNIPQSIYNLHHLRILDMSNNLLTEFPEDIGHLKGLQILRLAANDLEIIPSTIGSLTQLEELNLSQNRIHRLPSEMKGKLQIINTLQALFLAGNKIQSLPNEICELVQLHTLDLTGNEIHTLPTSLYHLSNLTVAHSYHKLEKCGLWLHKNPIVQPPPEIWRSDKPDHLFEYLQKLVTFNTENLQRQKIQLLGDTQCGKTSLARAITTRKSQLTNGPEDKTRLLKQTLCKSVNKVEFVVNDFGGDHAYRPFYRWFMDRKALVMLVYNTATLCEDNFHNCISRWLDMLSASCPGAVVKLVGTQIDLLQPQVSKNEHNQAMDIQHDLSCSEGSTETGTDKESVSDTDPQDTARNKNSNSAPEVLSQEKVHGMVMKYLYSKEVKVANELKALESDIAKTKALRHVDKNEAEVALRMMQVREKQLKDILQKPLQILPEVSQVSASESLEGIFQLTDDLEKLAIDKELFPHAWQQIPSHWKRLRLLLKQRKGYYLKWREIQQTAEMLQIQDEELRNCIQHLHNTADIMWISDDPVLQEIVFHKPKMLVDFIASLYRHDFADFLSYDNKVFPCTSGMTREQFQECSDMFNSTGEISQPLFKCLLFPISVPKDDIAMLLELFSFLDICYLVPDGPAAPLYNRPMIVLPWFNKNTDISFLKELWPENNADEDTELAVKYSFPFFCPPEIFPSLSIQIQDIVDERMDWKDHVFASRGMQMMLIHRLEENDDTVLTIRLKGPELSELHEFMSEIVNLVNIQIVGYSGLYWKLSIPTGLNSLKNIPYSLLKVK
ncbi:unnamed protein product, partial [Candidula unifasciata]